LQKEINYLRDLIGEDGIKPNPLEVLEIKEFLRSQISKNIKQFLDLAGYR